MRGPMTLSLLSLFFLLPMSGAQAMEVDEIIERNLEARGGLERIRAVNTMRMAGTMTMGPMEAPFNMELKRPDNIRFEMEFQGMRMVQAYDGETGWQIMPFIGKPDPEKMSAEDLDSIREQADAFDGPLVDWKEKGYSVELVGQEEIEGSEVWKLKVIRAEGREDVIYLDGEYFLDLRSETQRPIGGRPLQIVQDIGDYKEVDGLTIPHSIQVRIEGIPTPQSLRVLNVEVNPEIDDARFAMPETGN